MKAWYELECFMSTHYDEDSYLKPPIQKEIEMWVRRLRYADCRPALGSRTHF